MDFILLIYFILNTKPGYIAMKTNDTNKSIYTQILHVLKQIFSDFKQVAVKKILHYNDT